MLVIFSYNGVKYIHFFERLIFNFGLAIVQLDSYILYIYIIPLYENIIDITKRSF